MTQQNVEDVNYSEAARFIHLRAHSAYSLQEGAILTAKLIDLAVADSQAAVGLCDTANLFGALEFSEKAVGKGLQPIIGCTFQFAIDGVGNADNVRELPKIVLLCMNEVGYRNLMGLVSRAYMKSSENGVLAWDVDELQDNTDGLICLTGGLYGPINALLADGRASEAQNLAQTLAQLFSNRLYVELQRFEGYDTNIERQLVQIAYACELPLVATNDIYFAKREDYEAHDALLCIKDGRFIVEDDRRRETRDSYFKSQEEMLALFEDVPEATQNTLQIAKRCHYRPLTHSPILPRFTEGKPDEDDEQALAAEADELARQAKEGLARRLEAHGLAPDLERKDYEERLEYELGIITRMKFPGYFLIVADFIQWAKTQGIPVGPGRGSGAGSLVAWVLTITDLDPLRYSLLFERFLNPERVSMPDFDIDFCQDRRDEVISYVQQKYGTDQVAQIITFGSMQARVALRDVGRVMQLPYGQVDRLAKLIPNNPADAKTIKEALQDEPRLAEAREQEESVADLLDTSMRLEGLLRHASTHAAGIVIGDRPLDQLVPLYRDPRSSMPVTQFNMKWVEPAGLVKFDFLGLKTLTVIETCTKLLSKRGISIDVSDLPMDDVATYEMLTRGETVGVFQLESAGMRKALIGMKPDRFEDIIALVALYRPGPMENIPVYNDRKHGIEAVESIHEKIDHITDETQGVIIYQEQVMQIAQVLSGYSLGEADMLRRAMGKKIREEMDKQRARFVDGAVERGLQKQRANTIFDLLAKFADYGFNKSHAAAYALIAYQTAYLKAHYPAEFLAASMTLDMGNTDKLSEFKREAKRIDISVELPSVNNSGVDFDVRDGKIYYALSALKGAGEGAVEQIIEARGDRPFADIEDFFARVDSKAIKKNLLETLINAGCFDDIFKNRAQLSANVERLISDAQRKQRDAEIGQNDMFGSSEIAPKLELQPAQEWSNHEKLQRELASAGFYLSAHPLDEFASLLEKRRVQNWAGFQVNVKKGVNAGRLAGTVVSRQERNTRTGNRMGIVSLSDSTGQFEAVLFAEGLSKYRDLLEPGNSVVLLCSAEDRPEGISVRITKVDLLDTELGDVKRSMRVFVRNNDPIFALKKYLLEKGEASVSVVVDAPDAGAEYEVELPSRFAVTEQTVQQLRKLDGVNNVEWV